MKVKEYLMRKIKRGEKLHLSLIDPAEQFSKKAGEIAKKLEKFRTDAILVGGSFKVKQEKLDSTIKEIRSQTNLPVVLFPSSVAYLSKYADAVFFLSLLNSRDPRYIVREPARGTIIIKKYQIEPISIGYIVLEPGMKVGKKGRADLIKRKDIQRAIEYSLFAQFSGKDFVYLEAGSGATKPVPNEMIKAVKKEIEIPLIVGGGIVNKKIAKEKVKAGADVIVTGNIIEERIDALEDIISVVKSGAL